MSRGTRVCIGASVLLIILLAINYEFARTLYAYSFDPSYYAGTFYIRGGDISPPLGYPEDRVGGVLSILLVGFIIASVKLVRSDLKNKRIEHEPN
jgi:hypothetical protein